MSTSSSWIDFKALRAELDFKAVLAHYRVQIPSTGSQYKGPCPLPQHGDDRSRQSFSAELSRGIFQCFGCKAKGNVLEFAALMEGVNLEDGRGMRKVAMDLQARLLRKGKLADMAASPVEKAGVPSVGRGPRVKAVNVPLDFTLKGLNQVHLFFDEQGIEEQTVKHFGLGVCERGALKGRLAIPVDDLSGRLIGYIGRVLDDRAVSKENPKYLYPELRERQGVLHEFRSGNVLYNAHLQRSGLAELFVVEQPEEVWWLHQAGFPEVVATFGGATPAQAETLDQLLVPNGRIVVMTAAAGWKEDQAALAAECSAVRFTRWMCIPGVETLTAVAPSELQARLGRE